MRLIGLTGFGGTEVLRVEEAEMPRLGKGDVLIREAAAGVNRADLDQRQSQYPCGRFENGGADEQPWRPLTWRAESLPESWRKTDSHYRSAVGEYIGDLH